MKFGGTSLADAARVRHAAAIVASQPAACVAVVSAASGVTNLLLDAARAAAGDNASFVSRLTTDIRARHDAVLDAIADDRERAAAVATLDQLHAALNDSLAAVARNGELSKRLSDRIVATGEKAMSALLAATLRARGTPAVHVFADRVVATDGQHGNARPDPRRTRELAALEVQPHLDAGVTVIITGFIGCAPDGSTTTLGRGGSDYSATLLGAALAADEVQIWTDVPGVLSADPRQVADARVVPTVSYDEAQELAHFGAKVLHPRTIRPAVSLGIPVRILSTFAPEEPGTLVTREVTGESVKAVTALPNLLLLTVDVPELEDLAAASAAVFGALHDDRIEVVAASQASSRRRMTYVVDAAGHGGCTRVGKRMTEALRAADVEAEVGCQEDVALVAAVGAGAAAAPQALSLLLTVLGRAGISVISTNQQHSNAALTVAVPARDAARAVHALHEAFIGPQVASSRSRRPRRADLLAESLRVG
jgi:aspartate kinase